MAVPTNTLLSGNLKDIKENVDPVISDVTPEETVFHSNIGKSTKESSTRYDWYFDELAAPDNTNKRAEGDDVVRNSIAATPQPSRLHAWMQIVGKTVIMSETAMAVTVHGRDDEWARAIVRRGIELKRDINKIQVGTNQGTSGTDPRAMPSILAYIKTNTNIGGGSAANPSYTTEPTATRTDGDQRVFTEALLKDALRKRWASCGASSNATVYVGPVNKERMSGFTGIAELNATVTGTNKAVIYGAANIYRGEYETVTVVTERHMRERDCLIIDHKYVSNVHLRPYNLKPLGEQGDNKAALMTRELGLKVKNEKALAGIFDLTTT